jgi:hypothetical protein
MFSIAVNAQNLVFDNTFNNAIPHDDYDLTPDPDLSEYNIGGVKQLNDSVFVYFRNYVNWNAQQVISEVYAKTTHSDGAVSNDNLFASTNNLFPFGVNAGPELFLITDVVIANARIYILQNEAYDDGGTTKNGIYVHAYDYTNGSFYASTWASGGGSIQMADNITNAKGVVYSSGLITLAFRSSNGGPWQISSTTVGNVSGNVSFGTVTTLTNNTTGMSSEVADLIFISANEIYIADNASSCLGGNCNDMARILKYNPTNFSLVSDYTAGGTGFSEVMNWNSQTNTSSPQDVIRGILYQNGKILVVGDYYHFDGGPYALSKGRITRLNADGSIDNSFAVNSSVSGTFTNNFSNSFFRYEFQDIDLFSTGELLITANGTLGTGPSDPRQCFFLKLDANGELDTMLGNNGRLFEDQGYQTIKETIIIPGSSALTDKFLFNGQRILNPNPGTTTAMGRLVWSNGGTSGLGENSDIIFQLYPNPVTEVLNVKLSAPSAIIVSDINGKQLLNSLSKTTHQIQLNQLNPGVYLVQTENGSVQKFIKQ